MTTYLAKEQDGIYIIPIDRRDAPSTINLDTIKNPVVFSKEFWDYITSAFPYATIELFYKRDTGGKFHLTDTAYSNNIISFNNRLSVINGLPKDLSEKESNSYFKEGGFYVIPNDGSQHESQNTETRHEHEIKWHRASEKIEKEYLQF